MNTLVEEKHTQIVRVRVAGQTALRKEGTELTSLWTQATRPSMTQS